MAYILILLMVVAYPFHLPPVDNDSPWWTIVTAGLAHVSVFHLALNCLSLLSLWKVFGRFLRWTSLYFVVGILAGNTAQYVIGDMPAMGCSAGIFAILGAMSRVGPPWLRVRVFPLPWAMSVRALSIGALILTLIASKHVGMIPHFVGWLVGYYIATENENAPPT